jgi:iron complex transport system permease protein
MPSSRTAAVRLLWLTPIALLLILATALLGPSGIRWDELSGWWRGDSPAMGSSILWTLRAPRVALAALAGAGLAVGGVVFQLLFRNPLAEPYTLGIASGAALGAAGGFLLHVQGTFLGLPRMTLLAFCGAAITMTLVYMLARRRGDLTRLLLAGVCAGYMSGAGVLLVTYLSRTPVTNDLMRWLTGSLDKVGLGWSAALEILVVLGPALAYVLWSHRSLTLLALGTDVAATRGVNVQRVIWGNFICVGVLTAAIVARCGPIAFVGLMVPHMVRGLLGWHVLPSLLGAVLLGAAFLAACDAIARSLTASELPVGVVTNILGAGFFLYLLSRSDHSRQP